MVPNISTKLQAKVRFWVCVYVGSHELMPVFMHSMFVLTFTQLMSSGDSKLQFLCARYATYFQWL